eukprot:m.230332 g.230332  ORF g.230332 m.230332 type:complete len:326 (-) comp12046_c0_seq1:124-1101(-)
MKLVCRGRCGRLHDARRLAYRVGHACVPQRDVAVGLQVLEDVVALDRPQDPEDGQIGDARLVSAVEMLVAKRSDPLVDSLVQLLAGRGNAILLVEAVLGEQVHGGGPNVARRVALELGEVAVLEQIVERMHCFRGGAVDVCGQQVDQLVVHPLAPLLRVLGRSRRHIDGASDCRHRGCTGAEGPPPRASACGRGGRGGHRCRADVLRKECGQGLDDVARVVDLHTLDDSHWDLLVHRELQFLLEQRVDLDHAVWDLVVVQERADLVAERARLVLVEHHLELAHACNGREPLDRLCALANRDFACGCKREPRGSASGHASRKDSSW